MNGEKMVHIEKPEIEKVEGLPYDPEVEKKKLEVYEGIQKGWQTLIDKGMVILSDLLKTAEKRGLHKLSLLIAVILIIFIATAYLTYIKTVSGEAFMFFVGILVGYLLAYTLPRIQF
jgi:hypothetical protein